MNTLEIVNRPMTFEKVNGHDVLGDERELPENISPKQFNVRTSNQRLKDAKSQPEIRKLLSEIWMSNELHILFADTGMGKSIYGVAVADKLSKGENFFIFQNECEAQIVLYYDFELSDRQFRKRYTNDEGNDYLFSDNLYVDNIDFAELIALNPKKPLSELLFEKIKIDIEYTQAQVLIIDNLTYLSSQSTQDTQIALEVMIQLNILKKQYNLSILVLAHTPKRSSSSPLGVNDLAGSKHLSNFADSVSAIGKSIKDGTLRYIKQIKPSRSSEMVYDTNNVIVCSIIKDDRILTFEFVDFESEYEHLQSNNDEEKHERRNEQIEKAIQLHNQGISMSEIALTILGSEKSKGTISKWISKSKTQSFPTFP
ncbi:MAG: AAA family ATPase [Bacteroidota bacterium]